MSDTGHIELDRSIDSIVIGTRHRTDLGDLEPLASSIERLGLLQPITITPDGVLLCGRRRLEAVRQLGWRTVRVWVRTGLSDGLNHLLAMQDENALHKPLSPIEAARLYRELKQVMSEDAARRQRATRFGARDEEREAGGGESPPPCGTGKTRDQAAQAVTGRASYHRLEQVAEIQDAADSAPPPIRALASQLLKRIQAGMPVAQAHRALDEARRRDCENEPDTETLEDLARAALDRVRSNQSRRRRGPKRPRAPRARTTKAFVLTWSDLDGWTEHYDYEVLAKELSDDEWGQFERVVAATTAFAAEVRAARQSIHHQVSA